MIKCTICGKEVDVPQVHHDHFIEEVVRLWYRVAAREFALGFKYAKEHGSSIIGQKMGKLVALGSMKDCMRFAEPVSTCRPCNALDQVIKSHGPGGLARHPSMSLMWNFSLTPAEIGICVIRSDGSRRSNTDPEVSARVQDILGREKWKERLTSAEHTARTTLRQVIEDFPPSTTNNPIVIYKA